MIDEENVKNKQLLEGKINEFQKIFIDYSKIVEVTSKMDNRINEISNELKLKKNIIDEKVKFVQMKQENLTNIKNIIEIHDKKNEIYELEKIVYHHQMNLKNVMH